mmetsp:Transcript_16745/g.25811  ORF Transcript_16745/g.25811 Transcript_16745/m.25811 type:complete len:103 (+) Transcript_16745:1947-2255(+)
MEYMKKMGMKEYEYGTVVFYVDDTDNFRSTPLNQSHISDNEEADFDSNMLAELFDPHNPIKISKDIKGEMLNQSSFLERSQYQQLQLEHIGDNMELNFGDFE